MPKRRQHFAVDSHVNVAQHHRFEETGDFGLPGRVGMHGAELNRPKGVLTLAWRPWSASAAVMLLNQGTLAP